MIITEVVIVGVVGAVGTLFGALYKSHQDKKTSSFTHEEKVNEGLRADIVRKEGELSTLKEEIKRIEDLLDNQRKAYWELYDNYMELKIVAKSILLRNGWTLDEIEATIANDPPSIGRGNNNNG